MKEMTDHLKNCGGGVFECVNFDRWRIRVFILIWMVGTCLSWATGQCAPDNTTLQINSNTTWNSNVYVTGHALVTSGNTLTITANVMFRPGGTLTVEPNAVLIIDGGTLDVKLDCQDYWGGIIVLGDNSMPQTPISGYRHQGMVEIKNGGTISNALIAVSLHDRVSGSSGGGVLIANDANFINNRIGVDFLNYPGPGSGITTNNISRITTSNFLIVPNLIPYSGSYGPNRIGINTSGVRGIGIYGCHFEDQIYVGATTGTWGIRSLSSSIRVDAHCTNPFIVPCPVNQIIPTTFTTLLRGVFAFGSSDRDVRVDRCEFERCVYPISFELLENPLALRNQILMRFRVFNDPFGVAFTPGILLSVSDGYRVEENLIQANQRSVGQAAIMVEESGIEENLIYKNYINEFEEAHINDPFYGSTGATISNGQNADLTLIQGLQWRCNVFTDNQLDMMITPPGTVGIRKVQGIPGQNSRTVANIFNHSVPYVYDIFNNHTLNFPIDYYHGTGATYPNMVYGVNRLLAANTPDCPSRIKDIEESDPDDPQGLSTPGLSPDELTEYERLLDEILPEYASALDEIFARLDDGRSEEYKDQVATVEDPLDAEELYFEILGIAPFVSQEVLKGVIRNSAFEKEHVLDLIYANPDATKSEMFIEYLKLHAPFAVTSEIEQEIRASWNEKTALTEMLYVCAALSELCHESSALVLNEYKRTDQHPVELILDLYDRWPSLRYKYAYTDILIQQTEFTALYDYLNALPNRFKMSCKERVEHENYLRLSELLENVFSSNRYFNELTSQEIEELRQIREASVGRSASKAHMILCYFWDDCDYSKPDLCAEPSAEGRRLSKKQHGEEIRENTMHLNLYPNPVTNQFTIDFSSGQDDDQSLYIVICRNMIGHEMAKEKIKSNERSEWNVSDWSSGLYLLEFRSEEGVLLHQKRFIKR